jgi:hypothetical protein
MSHVHVWGRTEEVVALDLLRQACLFAGGKDHVGEGITARADLILRHLGSISEDNRYNEQKKKEKRNFNFKISSAPSDSSTTYWISL